MPADQPEPDPPSRSVGLVTADKLRVGVRIFIGAEVFMPGATPARAKSPGPAVNGMLFEATSVEITSISLACNLVGPARHKASIGGHAQMFELSDGRMLFLQGGYVLCEAAGEPVST